MTFKVNKDNCKVIYNYYRNQGYYSTILQDILHILLYTFIVLFSFFLTSCVDYNTLFDTHDIHASIHIRSPKVNAFVAICLLLLSLLWIWYFASFILQLSDLKKVKKFYNKKVGISDYELSTMKWDEIVDHNLDKVFINKQINQKDNFMIELYKEENWNQLGIHQRFSTKLFVWVIENSFQSVFFSSTKYRSVKTYTEKLKKYYIYSGVVLTILSPFTFLFLVVYYFFKYTMEFKKHPDSAGRRDWSMYAQWKLRKTNELPHEFENRLLKVNKHIHELLDTNFITLTSILAKFLTFVCGSFLAVLTVLTFYDDHILVMTIDKGGRSVLWYITFLGLMFTIFSSFIRDTQKDYNATELLKNVTDIIEYKPDKSFQDTLDEYNNLFSQKFMQLLEEILGVLALPYLLFRTLPNNSEYIAILFKKTMDYDEGLRGFYIKPPKTPKPESVHSSPNPFVGTPDTFTNKEIKLDILDDFKSNETSSNNRPPSPPYLSLDSDYDFTVHRSNNFNFGHLFSSVVGDNETKNVNSSDNSIESDDSENELLSKKLDELY